VGISSLTGAEADADAGTAVKAGSSARAGAGAEAAAGTSGTAPAGLPQTSQYPSTIVPVHPDCVQAEMSPLRDLAETPAPRPSTVGLASTADPGDAAEAAAGTNGTASTGLPQTSQYPSTIVPVHPGSVQVCMRSLPGLAETPDPRPTGICPASTADAGDTAEAAAPSGANGTAPAGLPQTSQYPSTILPVHPGCVQALIRPPFLVRAIEFAIIRLCRSHTGLQSGRRICKCTPTTWRRVTRRPRVTAALAREADQVVAVHQTFNRESPVVLATTAN
jgi:hypothetical protein